MCPDLLRVIKTKPLSWLCEAAGRHEVARPEVAQAVLEQLPSLPVTAKFFLKPLAVAGLQLTDGLLAQAARKHTHHVRRLADWMFKHGCWCDSNGDGATGLSGIYAAVLLDEPDWICQQHTTEVTAANLPDLLHIACAYSSNQTLKLLLRLGSQFLPDDYTICSFDSRDNATYFGPPPAAFPKVASDPQSLSGSPSAPESLLAAAERAEHQAWADASAGLLEACILPPAHVSNTVRSADKLTTLVERPACRLVDGGQVLHLLDLAMCDNRDVWYLTMLDDLPGTTAIAADDIYSLLTKGILHRSHDVNKLVWLLRLPNATNISTQNIMKAILLVTTHCPVDTRLVEWLDKHNQLLRGFSELLTGRVLGREEVMLLLLALLEHDDEAPTLLSHFVPINLDLVLEAEDVAALVDKAVSNRQYLTTCNLLKLHAALDLTPASVVKGLTALIDAHQQDTYRHVEVSALKAMLVLPAAQNISPGDTQKLLLSALEAKWYAGLTCLYSTPGQLSAAWSSLDPDILAPLLTDVFSDDDLHAMDFQVVSDVLRHPGLHLLSLHLLAAVLREAFAARNRAIRYLLPSPSYYKEHGSLHTCRLDSLKVSPSILLQLLLLPAAQELAVDEVQTLLVISRDWLDDACLGALMQLPTAQELPSQVVLQLLQDLVHRTGSQSEQLLLEALKLPGAQDLAPAAVADLIKSCMAGDPVNTSALQVLVQLPGAQDMSFLI